jgi:hypothetical protein
MEEPKDVRDKIHHVELLMDNRRLELAWTGQSSILQMDLRIRMPRDQCTVAA